MALACLPEAAARALLAEWLTEEGYEPMPPEHGHLQHDRMRVQYLRSFDDQEDTWDDALAIRRAMEALNALACCRGYGVDENPAFWRREFVERADPYENGSSSPYHVFAPGMLSRYCVAAFATKPVESTAVAFVTCFSMEPASSAMKARRAIHERLRPFLAYEPPLLELHVDPFTSGILNHDDGEPIEHVLRCLLETNRLWSSHSALSTFEERLHIDCITYAEAESLMSLAKIARIPNVELCKLDIVIREPPTPLAAQAASLLLSELARVDRTTSMQWTFRCTDRRCSEAIFSVVPSMRSLKHFGVTSLDLRVNDGDDADVRSYCAWLSYALRNVKEDVEATVQLVEGADKVLSTTWQSLHDLLEGLVFPGGSNPVVLPYGTSATLRAGTAMQTAISSRSKLGPVSLVAANDRRVDVIARCGSSAVLVWPGYGLMRVSDGDLSKWRTGDHPTTRRCIVKRFSFKESDFATVSAFLASVASEAQFLCLEEIRQQDWNKFRRILRSCTRLDTLYVSKMNCMKPLLRAYEDGYCTISTLSMGRVTDANRHTILQALRDTNTRIARHVSHIHFHGGSTDPKQLLNDTVNLLVDNQRIKYVSLDEVWNDTEAGVGDRLLSAFVDRPVMQTTASKFGAYTFLLSARRTRVLRSLPVDCTKTIVQFAATPALRHVAWEERPWEV